MTFHTCFRASKSTARHLNMWYYNHRCVRASGMPEYCLVMQLHSIMVMWYSCSIHLVVCITGSGGTWQSRFTPRIPNSYWAGVLHEGACLWSCVFRWCGQRGGGRGSGLQVLRLYPRDLAKLFGVCAWTLHLTPADGHHLSACGKRFQTVMNN